MCLVSIAVFASEPLLAAEKVAAESPLHLIVDHLPVAVYAGDEIVINLRVENTTKQESKVELVLTETARADGASNARSQSLKCAPSTFTSASFSIASQNVTSFLVELKQGETREVMKCDVLHDDEPFPKALIQGGVLAKENARDERVIWTPTRREKKVDRAFLPMKWLLGKPDSVQGRNAGALALVPGGYGSAEGLGPYKLDGAPPLLHAALTLLSRTDGVKHAVFGMPPEDLDAATDPRLFRIILDGTLQRLKAEGVEQRVVIPPFRYGASEARMKVLWKETVEACSAYQTTYADPTEMLNEIYWRADASQTGVYAGRPNAEGRKKMAAFLESFGVKAGLEK